MEAEHVEHLRKWATMRLGDLLPTTDQGPGRDGVLSAIAKELLDQRDRLDRLERERHWELP